MVSCVIVAGGKGERMGAEINKVYLPLMDKEILALTMEAFEKNKSIDEIIVVTRKEDMTLCASLVQRYGLSKVSKLVQGGDTRQESVYNGLVVARGDIVAIHDGARALVSQQEIDAVICDCKKYGAAALGVKVKNTLKSACDGFIQKTIDRENIYEIQTPQVFRKEEIIKAHQKAEDAFATDDCALAEAMGIKIKITEGTYNNIKITTPEDIAVAENILQNR